MYSERGSSDFLLLAVAGVVAWLVYEAVASKASAATPAVNADMGGTDFGIAVPATSSW
jgi:hypothetical protein